MHVAQVEHGLCAVLLLRRQTIMNDCSLIVHIGAIAIEMIVAKLDSGHCVACAQTERWLS